VVEAEVAPSSAISSALKATKEVLVRAAAERAAMVLPELPEVLPPRCSLSSDCSAATLRCQQGALLEHKALKDCKAAMADRPSPQEAVVDREEAEARGVRRSCSGHPRSLSEVRRSFAAMARLAQEVLQARLAPMVPTRATAEAAEVAEVVAVREVVEDSSSRATPRSPTQEPPCKSRAVREAQAGVEERAASATLQVPRSTEVPEVKALQGVQAATDSSRSFRWRHLPDQEFKIRTARSTSSRVIPRLPFVCTKRLPMP